MYENPARRLMAGVNIADLTPSKRAAISVGWKSAADCLVVDSGMRGVTSNYRKRNLMEYHGRDVVYGRSTCHIARPRQAFPWNSAGGQIDTREDESRAPRNPLLKWRRSTAEAIVESSLLVLESFNMGGGLSPWLLLHSAQGDLRPWIFYVSCAPRCSLL